MATPGVDRLLVDTNILVYATDADSPWQPAAESALEEWRKQGTELCVTVQVLREYLAVVTRPASGQVAPPDYNAICANLACFRSAFHMLEETRLISEKLEELTRHFLVKGRQVHDANIVATMCGHGLRDILTHNTSDFGRFSTLITVHPL